MRATVRVEGIVQGVGFRPYVHALATAARPGRAGWATTRTGVFIEVEGAPTAVERFRAALRPAAAAARADRAGHRARPIAPTRRDRVHHRAEPGRWRRGTRWSPPDTATCADCLAELFDPADRRYRYPFVNCTNCGPRFTIVTGRAVRPAADHDGRLRRCARTARRSTTTRPTGGSTPSRSAARPAARAAAARPRGRSATVTWPTRPDRARRGRVARRPGRSRQGPRRLPPGGRRRREPRGRGAAGAASTGRTSRSR